MIHFLFWKASVWNNSATIGNVASNIMLVDSGGKPIGLVGVFFSFNSYSRHKAQAVHWLHHCWCSISVSESWISDVNVEVATKGKSLPSEWVLIIGLQDSKEYKIWQAFIKIELVSKIVSFVFFIQFLFSGRHEVLWILAWITFCRYPSFMHYLFGIRHAVFNNNLRKLLNESSLNQTLIFSALSVRFLPLIKSYFSGIESSSFPKSVFWFSFIFVAATLQSFSSFSSVWCCCPRQWRWVVCVVWRCAPLTSVSSAVAHHACHYCAGACSGRSWRRWHGWLRES